jgi:hypothetical protein
MPFYEHLDELGTADGKKQYAGLVGHGPGEQRRNLCHVSSRSVFPRSATSGRPVCTADGAHESPMEGCKVSDELCNAALEVSQLVIIEALEEFNESEPLIPGDATEKLRVQGDARIIIRPVQAFAAPG